MVKDKQTDNAEGAVDKGAASAGATDKGAASAGATDKGAVRSLDGVLIAIGFGIIAALWVVLIIGASFSWEQLDKRRSARTDGDFAYTFSMDCAADPQLDTRYYGSAILKNLDAYSEILFVTELPPPNQVEQGSIYFAPSKRTEDILVFFNSEIKNNRPKLELEFPGFDLDSPVTTTRLISEYKDMERICEILEFDYMTVNKEYNYSIFAAGLHYY